MYTFKRDVKIYVEWDSILYRIWTTDDEIKASNRHKRIDVSPGEAPYRGQESFNIQEEEYIIEFSTHIKQSHTYTSDVILYSLFTNDLTPIYIRDHRYLFRFDESNRSIMPEFNMYIEFGSYYQKVQFCQVDSLTYDLGTSEYLKAKWRLIGIRAERVAELPSSARQYTDNLYIPANRLSCYLALDGQSYQLPIVSASITYTHSLAMLIPDELPIVNTPIGAITGTRKAYGEIDMFLDTRTDYLPYLYSRLRPNNRTPLNVTVGGAYAREKTVSFYFPRAHISYTAPITDDIIKARLKFVGQATSLDYANEAFITHFMPKIEAVPTLGSAEVVPMEHGAINESSGIFDLTPGGYLTIEKPEGEFAISFFFYSAEYDTGPSLIDTNPVTGSSRIYYSGLLKQTLATIGSLEFIVNADGIFYSPQLVGATLDAAGRNDFWMLTIAVSFDEIALFQDGYIVSREPSQLQPSGPIQIGPFQGKAYGFSILHGMPTEEDVQEIHDAGITELHRILLMGQDPSVVNMEEQPFHFPQPVNCNGYS